MKRVLALCAMLPTVAFAELSAEVALVSDYRYNGVSNSDRNPALQAGINYQSDVGVYLGAWGSNVDFGEETAEKVEIDYYLGYYRDLNDTWGIDLGLYQYTYLGDDGATDSNYLEYSVGVYFQGNTSLYWNYSDDYFGSGAKHHLFTLAHTISVDEYAVTFKATHNESSDGTKYGWSGADGEGKSYQHVEVSVAREYKGFDIALTAMATTIDNGPNEDWAGPMLTLSLARGFTF